MKKFIIAALLSLGAVGAQASIISYEFGFPLETTEINKTGSLGLFDSNLGILTGATLTIEGAAAFSFSGTNNAEQSQTAQITSSTSLFWSSALPLPFSTIGLSASSDLQTYAAGETKNFGPFNRNDSAVNDLSSILGSLQLAGGGNFDLGCASLSGLSVLGGGGNVTVTQNTRAGCGAKIEYQYTERTTQVPEPGSLALMGLGLLAAGFASRRRNRG